MALTKTGIYFAVRRSDGREWIDLDTYSGMPDDARRQAEKTDRSLPGWAEANPIVRVVRCDVVEQE